MPNVTVSAEAVLKIASAEIGYKEKSYNSNLDNFTANAGSGNWTKYARDLALAGYYNGNKNGYAWCDVFVDWCFYQACGKNASIAQSIQCQTGDLGAACQFSAQYYKSAGRWTTTPTVGAQIFFYSGGGINHTGIVEKFDGTYVTTIEGNTSDMVARRTYGRYDGSIAGYGLPKYGTSIQTDASQSAVEKPQLKMIQVALPELSKGCTGQAVKSAQVLLKQRGYDIGSYGADGDFGTQTENAVKLFQSSNKLTSDGEIGKDTWTKLING